MSEAAEEIQRLTNEVERLEVIDTDRERHFVLLKEKAVAIEQQFNVMASERNRFNASINRLAEIVGLSGKQCFAPEAVERKAKYELATLRGRVEDLGGKRFPIQGGPSIPWRMILPHEGQLQKNHGQTLERMAERGGLSPSEALCVLDGEGWRGSRWGDFACAGRGDHPKEKAARDELERRRAAFEDETNDLREEIAALKEYRTSVCQKERGPDDAGFTQEEAHFWKQAAERDGTEIQRLKTAAIECDFRVLQCPVLKGEDLDLLDAKEVCPEEEADWQDGNKEVYGPGTIPGIGPSEEIVLADQGEPVVVVRKGTDFGCDDHDARPHSRCYVCDGSGIVPGAFLSHVRQPCETCGGTGNELGPPFPMCHKMPECPNKECPHFKLEDNRCGRKTEDHIVRNPPLNLGPVDEKENGEEVQD